MKKKVLFAAMALVALASCSSDEIASLSSPPESTVTDSETPGAIVFSSASKGITRADITGADAATLLGGKFVVSGKKGSLTAATNGNIVFDNYLVEWTENTAHTTESNTKNWEYVGKGRIKHAIDNGITSQTIKYWDYSQPQYDFIAWSTGSKIAVYDESDLEDGKVYVTAINPNATATEAYVFKGKAADLSQCYIADLVTVKKADYAKHENENPVTFRFRQLGTKVRIGIYETIPGYSVKDVKFYSAAAVGLLNEDDVTPDTEHDGYATVGDYNKAKNGEARIFTTQTNGIFTEGTYTITFPTVDTPTDADNNQAHVEFSAGGVTQSTVVEWGGLNYTIAEDGEKKGTEFLGRTSNTASFAGEAGDNYYVIYLPNQNGTNLNLRVNYTLESTDGSGEEITVKGATAQVPSIYTQWKPGFAYTYLFKISDKTNGYTGVYDPTQPDNTTVNSEPAGLYPITFDAVVVNADDTDKTQETITTVSTPSITTYQKGSTVINNDEYKAITGDIYVTVNDGNAGSTPDLANGALQDLSDKSALYKLPVGNYTEADVIDAMQMQDDDAASGTIKGRSGLVLTSKGLTLTNTVEYGVDGNAIEIPVDGSKKKAAKFTPSAEGYGAGTYAFVYIKTASTPANDKVMYQAVDFTDATVATKYRYGYKDPTTADAQKGVKYFLRSGDAAPYTYTMQDPFIGQGVSNLYLDAAGNTIASGYAVTGTDYYYTTDHGMSYTKATNIAYAAFETTTLYKDDACTIEKTETTPADGQAYYDSTGKYCVILPQQTTGWYELKTDTYVKADESAKVDGQTYFDKYTKNDGVYYTKIIKVQ